MYRFLLLLAFLLAGRAYGQKPAARYSISGYLKNLNNQTIYLIPRSERQAPTSGLRPPRIDSSFSVDGHFTLEGNLGEPNYYAIGIKGQDHNRFKSFILDNTPITIRGNADSLDQATIAGGSSQRDQLILNRAIELYLKQQKNLEPALLNALQKAAKDSQLVLNNQYRKLTNDILDVKATFIGFNTKSFVSLFTLQEILPELPKEQARSLFNNLDYSLQMHSVGKQIHDQVYKEIATLSSPRQSAPNLILADKKEKPVNLSDYKGNVLLIDFWASWCDHCRQEHNRLKTLYKQYKSKGLEIISISVDEDSKAWKKALQKAGLPWTQLSDRVGQTNVVGTQYSTNSIPMNVLIDKEGFVIRKGLHGAELEKQLALVLNNP